MTKYLNPFTDENSFKYYQDLKNSMDTARYEGKEEGIEIGREEGIEIGIGMGIEIRTKTIALALLGEGIDEDVILKATGLTVEQLAQLRRESSG